MADRLVITGASGFLGRQLVPLLEQAGYVLTLAGRSPERLHQLFPDRHICAVQDIAQEAEECRALLHLAVQNNDVASTEEAFMAANADTLQQVLTLQEKAGIKTLIYPTSLHATPDAKTAYGRSKYAAEQLLAGTTDLTVHLLRLPAVYGTQFQGRLKILNRVPPFARPVARQALGCVKPMVHIETVAQAMQDTLKRSGPSEQIVTDDADQNLIYRASKRFIDLGFALFVVIALWWLLLIVWIAVRLTSPGPGLFAQERLGQDQRPFTCYKFRTMQTGTKQAGTHEVSQASVTKLGQFLRRSKIDELPQVLNIFKGELSLVGPRPGLPVQHALTAARAAQGVFAVRPGITGLAQVNGVDMSDPDALARLDATYIKTRTLLLDLKIILATGLGRGLGDRTAQ
ncbi:MAG: sugar transferase [Roseobacter sp.]